MQATNLAVLEPGQCATITQIHVEEDLYHRLAAMGFRVGKQIHMVRRGRFAGPLHVRIGTTELMIRRNEARNIDVLPC
jgi:ferrous iron transport protein A